MRNLRACEPFSLHDNETLALSLMHADGRVRDGERPRPACAGDATRPTDNASARERNRPRGDKLAKSDGVLCPPSGVDPEIRAPTPDTGNTPVIPPPGSPGGDPSVRPK